MISLNQEILNIISSGNNEYQDKTNQIQQKQQYLQNNYNILLEEKEKVHSLFRQMETVDEANANSQLVVIQFYSQYIVYLLIVVIVILLFLRIVSSGDGGQRGGGTQLNDYLFLIGIMVLLLGISVIFREMTGGVLFSLIAIGILLIKLRIIKK